MRARIGDVAVLLDDQAVQRFRPVEREMGAEPPVERAQLRDAVDDDAAVGSRGGSVSAPPGACVVNSPMISSMMSSIVIRPSSSPYSSTTSAQALAVALELRAAGSSSGVPVGTK